ncbi:glycosyl hydrolase family 18 protein [Paenibacillus humicola]|uniref:glycosyl hydrolase family 18 protein n=1 Tax=Paenibacillus humicola TaxID=3110540 RepID=UPI00237A4AC3|nr:glycosyl hydrolase family 18 protein [Paenibacillus humicola]
MKRAISALLVMLLILPGCAGTVRKQAVPDAKEQTNPQSRAYQINTPNQKGNEMSPLQTESKKRSVTSVGFLEPIESGPAVKEVKNVGDHLSYVAFFSYRVKPSGDLIGLNDAKAIQATKRSGSVPMMVVTNFMEGNFSPAIAHRVFTDKAVSRRLIQSVLTTMKAKGFGALNIDFEHIRAADRELYNGFLETIIPLVRNAGYPVSTALAPKTSGEQAGPWHGAHDYKRHGELADFVVLMTYEWGWSGGPPMAVAPIPQVRQVLDYAVSVIPRHKIVMGAPLYGYDWTLPYRKGGPWAKRIAPEEAADLAVKEGASVQYDNAAQAPHFNYTDPKGKQHEVWFENEQSMQAKFNLIKQYKLRGVAYWVLGEPFPQNWSLLRDNFYIRKASAVK